MVDVIESLQLALFLRSPPASSDSALELWKFASTSQPTGFNKLGPDASQAQGIVDDLDVVLLVRADRVDLICQGLPRGGANPVQSTTAPLSPPSLELDRAREWALAAADRMIHVLQVGRTAAVVQGHFAAQDGADSVRIASEQIPNLPSPKKATEISYQIVLPAFSERGSRSIKQIIRWNSAMLQFFNMPLVGIPLVKSLAQRYVLSFYVDIFLENQEVMDDAAAQESLKEVVEKACHIFKEGYRAIL